MARHPDIVPTKHDDRDREDAGIEKLLADASKERRKGAREHRRDTGPEDAGGRARGNPPFPMSNRPRRRHHDADDETGFEDFAKDDDQGTDHGLLYCTIKVPVVALWKSSKNV